MGVLDFDDVRDLFFVRFLGLFDLDRLLRSPDLFLDFDFDFRRGFERDFDFDLDLCLRKMLVFGELDFDRDLDFDLEVDLCRSELVDFDLDLDFDPLRAFLAFFSADNLRRRDQERTKRPRVGDRSGERALKAPDRDRVYDLDLDLEREYDLVSEF